MTPLTRTDPTLTVLDDCAVLSSVSTPVTETSAATVHFGAPPASEAAISFIATSSEPSATVIAGLPSADGMLVLNPATLVLPAKFTDVAPPDTWALKVGNDVCTLSAAKVMEPPSCGMLAANPAISEPIAPSTLTSPPATLALKFCTSTRADWTLASVPGCPFAPGAVSLKADMLVDPVVCTDVAPPDIWAFRVGNDVCT